MKTPIYSFGLVVTVISLASCNKTQFNTNNSAFEQIHNELVSDGHEAIETMDTEVHSYNFSLSETKTLSSIGYESNRKLKNTDYLIEIVNASDSSILYSENHQFKANKISYVTPTSNVIFQSNVIYQLNRIQTNWGDDITSTIGHIVRTTDSDYPLNKGLLTISETNFFDYGESTSAWSQNTAIPRIDLVFK